MHSKKFEDHKKRSESSQFFVKSNFLEIYESAVSTISSVVNAAKIYIIENHHLITNWSGLLISIRYMDPVERAYTVKYYDATNLIETLDDIVLDTIDGDFSIRVNGLDLLWINNESVVEIAHYIEQQLRKT